MTAIASGTRSTASPSTGLQASRAGFAQRLRECDFPIYGLDSTWAGRRWIGGWGTRDDVLDRIELAHGEAMSDSEPLVRVETRLPSLGEHSFDSAARGLATQLWHHGAEHDVVRPSFAPGEATASWEEVTLYLSGQPTSFRRLAAEPWWVAIGWAEEQIVSLVARGIASSQVRLVLVEDRESYLLDDGMPLEGSG